MIHTLDTQDTVVPVSHRVWEYVREHGEVDASSIRRGMGLPSQAVHNALIALVRNRTLLKNLSGAVAKQGQRNALFSVVPGRRPVLKAACATEKLPVCEPVDNSIATARLVRL